MNLKITWSLVKIQVAIVKSKAMLQIGQFCFKSESAAFPNFISQSSQFLDCSPNWENLNTKSEKHFSGSMKNMYVLPFDPKCDNLTFKIISTSTV